MQTMRAAIFGSLLVLLASSAFAQAPGSGPAGGLLTFGGRSVAVGPSLNAQPTPLFFIGGLPFGIWAPVEASYDAAANRNLAASPTW